VETFGIVAELDVACHVFAGLFARWVRGAVNPLDLQSRVERFGLGIIKTRSHPPHGMTHIELGGCVGERLAKILGVSVSVEDRLRFETVVARRHAQRVDDQLGAHMIGDGVPDTFFGAAVDHRC
jgi:hypothetical protein